MDKTAVKTLSLKRTIKTRLISSIPSDSTKIVIIGSSITRKDFCDIASIVCTIKSEMLSI